MRSDLPNLFSARNQPGYIGSYAMDGLAMALHCVWTTTNFKDALLKCANLRGDSDSVCAVVGQIAGKKRVSYASSQDSRIYLWVFFNSSLLDTNSA